ncbi:adenosylcobinamide-GDP ribazoletransferase [Ornithinimicrobium sp. LYQ92]|uniref:adenosylcobinamide-GDP ribazoletransferase n=1 Tax=Serinicoccus sp. LYQ92 TaxID=3378798 RepID=UPI003851A727
MTGPLLDATSFLTRLPVPARRRFDLARAAWAFPVVGAGVGALTAALAWSAHLLLPVLVAATLAVLLEVVVTGALHLDGLADCADGCGGGQDRAARLRIMKDHAVGVYGGAALVLALLLQVGVLAGLLGVLGGGQLLMLLLASGALSRAAMLPPARWLRYARAEGTAGALVAGLGTGPVVAAAGLAVAATAGTLLLVGPWVALAQLAAAVVTPALVSRWAYRSLGGVTGDVLGATAELTRTACLLVPLALLGWA